MKKQFLLNKSSVFKKVLSLVVISLFGIVFSCQKVDDPMENDQDYGLNIEKLILGKWSLFRAEYETGEIINIEDFGEDASFLLYFYEDKTVKHVYNIEVFEEEFGTYYIEQDILFIIGLPEFSEDGFEILEINENILTFSFGDNFYYFEKEFD